MPQRRFEMRIAVLETSVGEHARIDVYAAEQHLIGHFTGPLKDSVSSANWIADTTSSSAIQLRYCRPEPIAPPTPMRNGGSILASAPPLGPSTRAIRTLTTRMPAS